MSSRVTVDGSVLGHTLWGGMEDVTEIYTSGRSRIANGFTGSTVFQVGVQPKKLSVTFWTELLGGGSSLVQGVLR